MFITNDCVNCSYGRGTIEQKRLGSNAGEINILELSDYYRYNYISGKKTIFYTYLSKK